MMQPNGSDVRMGGYGVISRPRHMYMSTLSNGALVLRSGISLLTTHSSSRLTHHFAAQGNHIFAS